MSDHAPTPPQPVHFARPDQGEEGERAELYGLLARLWLAPPDAALMSAFRTAVTEAPEAGAFLQAPWEDLVGALRAQTLDGAQAEFEALFGGVGKPELFRYGSYHLAGFLNEKPLAALRSDLAALGLTRDEASGETEDHLSYGLEVMRYLIAGDDPAVCHLEQQRRFFRSHLQPWVGLFCDSVCAHPRASLYAALARFTQAFMQVEAQAFDMVE